MKICLVAAYTVSMLMLLLCLPGTYQNDRSPKGMWQIFSDMVFTVGFAPPFYVAELRFMGITKAFRIQQKYDYLLNESPAILKSININEGQLPHCTFCQHNLLSDEQLFSHVDTHFYDS